MWLTTLWHEGAGSLQWSVVLGASCAAALIDLRTRRVPNLLTAPMLLLGYAAAANVGGLAGLADAGAASLLVSAPYVLLFLLAGGGSGDAKLMAAIGAWLGVINGAIVMMAVALAGVAMASIVLMVHARRAAPRGGLGGSAGSGPATITIPYGVAVCAGVWAAAAGVFLWT